MITMTTLPTESYGRYANFQWQNSSSIPVRVSTITDIAVIVVITQQLHITFAILSDHVDLHSIDSMLTTIEFKRLSIDFE